MVHSHGVTMGTRPHTWALELLGSWVGPLSGYARLESDGRAERAAANSTLAQRTIRRIARGLRRCTLRCLKSTLGHQHHAGQVMVWKAITLRRWLLAFWARAVVRRLDPTQVFRDALAAERVHTSRERVVGSSYTFRQVGHLSASRILSTRVGSLAETTALGGSIAFAAVAWTSAASLPMECLRCCCTHGSKGGISAPLHVLGRLRFLALICCDDPPRAPLVPRAVLHIGSKQIPRWWPQARRAYIVLFTT